MLPRAPRAPGQGRPPRPPRAARTAPRTVSPRSLPGHGPAVLPARATGRAAGGAGVAARREMRATWAG
uniref:Uncharacterized protein n=1 Tax=Myotis myotis TaxID=51298 RepID=A0A7J7WUR3_MYOMY|nr:hypothetical protein mMyoMyo1_000547 [Myotis myotis]